MVEPPTPALVTNIELFPMKGVRGDSHLTRFVIQEQLEWPLRERVYSFLNRYDSRDRNLASPPLWSLSPQTGLALATSFEVADRRGT